MKTAAVVGAGAWGTAIAQSLARAGLTPTLWAHEPATAAAIRTARENADFLPGVALDPAVSATADLADAVGGKDLIVWVTPAQHFRATLARAAAHLPGGAPLVLATKGIETGTGLLMSEIAAELAPDRPLAVLF